MIQGFISHVLEKRPQNAVEAAVEYFVHDKSREM
jgi:hypothetical protein